MSDAIVFTIDGVEVQGQPGQTSPCSHGAAPARFRSVNVLNTRREV